MDVRVAKEYLHIRDWLKQGSCADASALQPRDGQGHGSFDADPNAGHGPRPPGRSTGRQPKVRWDRQMAFVDSHDDTWSLKSAGEAKQRPGRNEVSRYPLNRSTNPFASGSPGLQMITLIPSMPRNASNASVSFALPPLRELNAASPSQTRARGTDPHPVSTLQCPAMRSSAWRVGIITAPGCREYPDSIVSTGGRAT